MASLAWKFTLTLPELARVLELNEATARTAGEDCRIASVDVYSTDGIQRKFGLDDAELLAKFRELKAAKPRP